MRKAGKYIFLHLMSVLKLKHLDCFGLELDENVIASCTNFSRGKYVKTSNNMYFAFVPRESIQ